MSNIDIVKRYFELSNQGNLEEIERILQDDIIYSSENVGIHFGKKNVMKMKKNFFGKFNSLHWKVLEVNESTENIFEINFVLNAELLTGKEIEKSGREVAIVKDGKIFFIQVKNA